MYESMHVWVPGIVCGWAHCAGDVVLVVGRSSR